VKEGGGEEGERERERAGEVCVYYCSTYYKAVREGGGVFVELLQSWQTMQSVVRFHGGNKR